MVFSYSFFLSLLLTELFCPIAFNQIFLCLHFALIRSVNLKNLFLIIWGILLSINIFAQAQITRPAFTKSIIDFGAVPNDGKDDTWAFIKAGKYFNNLWDINGVPLAQGNQNFSFTKYSGKLVIPSGVYLVGKQVSIPAAGLNTTYGAVFGYPKANGPIRFAPGWAYKAGLELISINEVDQFSIIGMGKTTPVIKYNDGLAIGYFNSNGQPVWFPASAYGLNYGVTIGSFLEAKNCKNIFIENIAVDGNNTPTLDGGKTMYNGGWVSDLIQRGATGAYFLNTKNVTLNKLNIHHMTLDGILFQDFYKDTLLYPKQAFSNLLITDTKCDYNRRQGFSWVGGRKVTVKNSSFNHTGTTASGIAAGNPGAGVDIEPEADGTTLLLCVDGTFTNCQFINNKGCALVNDETAGRSKNMLFSNCTFWDVEGYSVWVKGRSFTFKNCKIWGGFVFGNNGEVAGEETRFYNCDFADEEMPGKKGIYNTDFALIESWQYAKRLLFSNCSFRTIHPKQRLAAIYSKSKEEVDFTVFSFCKFSVNYGNENDLLFGCVFDGNTSFNNIGKQVGIMSMNGIIFKGSNDAKKPYTFNLQGNTILKPANTNGPQLTQFVIGRSSTGNLNLGYLNFMVGAQSCLFSHWDQTIDIGKNASFINKGQLAMLNGNINLEGKFKLEAGSHTAFFNPVNFNSSTGQAPELSYNNASHFDVNESWKKNLDGLGKGQPISNMKFSKKIKLSKVNQ